MQKEFPAKSDREVARCAAVEEWKSVATRHVLESAENCGPEPSSEELWCSFRDATVEAARETLGKCRRRQPDWFQASMATLEPALAHRNTLFHQWLANPSTQLRSVYVAARAEARKAVKQAKATWYRETAAVAERGKFGQKQVWDSIRDLQSAHRGLIPCRTSTIKKTDGTVCSSTEEQLERWREHFLQVLNVRSTFSETEIGQLRQRPVYEELAEIPLSLGSTQSHQSTL